jgi:hypothetical protein
MTTGQPLFNPTVSGHVREREPLRHEAEFAQIEESLHSIHATLEALRREAERRVDGGEDDEEPRGEGDRR